MASVPPERHFGFQCRGCRVVNFPGRRYSCEVCPAYHLCGDCFDANLGPEIPGHLYYHPLKAYYTRAAFQLYFEGDAESYSSGNLSLQSYKCALCDVRGLTSAALSKHLSQCHRSHPDYNDYADLVFAYYQTDSFKTPVGSPPDEEMDLRVSGGVGDFLLPPAQTGRTTQPRGGFGEDNLNLAQLLGHLKMLNITSSEFPVRCVEILKRAHSLQAQQNGQAVVKTAEKYVNQIEREVAAGLCERRLRLGRTSMRVVHRNGAMIVLPGLNAAEAMRYPSTTPGTSRVLRGLDFMAGNEDYPWPGIIRPGKYRQAVVSSKQPKVSQDIEDQQVENKVSDEKNRFLCSQFIVETKPLNRSRADNGQPKANFVEALLCSMLADEELSPLPLKPISEDAVKSLQKEQQKKLAIVSVKPKAGAKNILPMQQPYMNEMIRFYKALDEYKNKMDNPEDNHQFSIMDAPLDSNGDGDGSDMPENGNESASGVNNTEIQEPARSDSDLLEITMARIIEGIDAIIDEDGNV